MYSFKIQRLRDDYEEFLESVEPYTSLQEKNATLLGATDETVSAIKLAKKLGISNFLNEYEAIALIFKARKKSVSEFIEYTHICKECKYSTVAAYNIDDLFFTDVLDPELPVGLFASPEEVLEEDELAEIEIDDYNDLEKRLYKNSIKIFNPVFTAKCKRCGLEEKKTFMAKDIISGYDIKSIYEQYCDISYYSSMTKQDVDSMFPFERDIFIGLLQKRENAKMEAIKNQQNQNSQNYGARLY